MAEIPTTGNETSVTRNQERTFHVKLTEILDSSEHWVKGYASRISDQGIHQYCLVGAIELMPGIGFSGRLDVIVREIICENPEFGRRARQNMFDAKWYSIQRFNDHPDTTFEEVHAVAAEADRRYALKFG